MSPKLCKLFLQQLSRVQLTMGQMSQGQLSGGGGAIDHGANVSGAIVWGGIYHGALDQGSIDLDPVGTKNGLVALLKKDVKELVAVRCICHKLGLSCTDTNVQLKKIGDVELEVTQLWKIFDNSPTKLAAYLKIQEETKHESGTRPGELFHDATKAEG